MNEPTPASSPPQPGHEPLKVLPPEASITRISLRTAAILLFYTVAFTALMAATYVATKPAINASAKAEKLRLIGEVLPPTFYDNALLDDAITLPPLKQLGTEQATSLYRARKGGATVALVFEAVAPDGYSGRIGLLLALAPDGRLLALRVAEHKETPGLGDYIDPKKDRNKERPWIAQFDGVGTDTARGGQWQVRKDGGRFDARAGATISARAVTNASGRALLWVTERQTALFSLPSGSRFEETKP